MQRRQSAAQRAFGFSRILRTGYIGARDWSGCAGRVKAAQSCNARFGRARRWFALRYSLRGVLGRASELRTGARILAREHDYRLYRRGFGNRLFDADKCLTQWCRTIEVEQRTVACFEHIGFRFDRFDFARGFSARQGVYAFGGSRCDSRDARRFGLDRLSCRGCGYSD